MNGQLRAYQLSIGIHAVLVLALLVFSSGLGAVARTRALDLSMLGGPPAPPPERPLHPRARFGPGAAAPLPPKAPEPVQPQAQRVNATAGMAPAASPPAAEPEQAPALSRDAIRERYSNENYSYIRDRIHRNLSYPQMARKMGWSGRVLVSFTVCTDGGVKDVRIVSGCGFEALDRSAVETIKSGSPYPPPPVETEFVMPITYRLE